MGLRNIYRVKEYSDKVEPLGIEVRNLTDDLAERLGYEGMNGVLVTQVEPGSLAERAGIKAWMLIQEVDRVTIKNTNDFNDAIEEASKAGKVLLLIHTGRYNQYIALPLK